MTFKSSLFLLAGFFAFSNQETLDLGSLDQYNGTLSNPPTLSGSTVWVSGSDAGDYDILLSTETQNKVLNVLGDCGDSINNKCYQDVLYVLKSSELQIDPQLDRRHFGHMLAKTFGKLGPGAFLVFMASILTASWEQWRMKHTKFEPALKFLPHSQLSTAINLTTATNIVLSAEGKVVATITPEIATTTLHGSKTPEITVVSTAHGSFATGDIAAILDADLAKRIGEIMARMSDCEDGRSFDANKASGRSKRAGTNYGAAICGVEAVVINAQPGGALTDLLLIDPAQLNFNFVGDAARAAGVAAAFVQEYAPLLDITPERAARLNAFLCVLAFNLLLWLQSPGPENRFPSSLVTTATITSMTTASATSSGCPDPTTSPLFCGYVEEEDCKVELPKQATEEPKCKEGNYKGCKCNTPLDIFINYASVEEQQAMNLTSILMNNAAFVPVPPTPGKSICNLNTLTAIPASIFGGQNNHVYDHFCDKWAASVQLKMAVDVKGNSRAPEGQLLLRPREGPLRLDDFSKYNFDLGFVPNQGGKACTLDCKAAFHKMYQDCSNKATTNEFMQRSGSINVECGVFNYDIAQTIPLSLQPRHCYGSNEFGPHNDIHLDQIRTLASYACAGSALRTVNRGDPTTNRAYAGYDDYQPIQLNNYWQDGCVLDSGLDKVFASNPLVVKDPGWTYCMDLFTENYQKCDNTGVGGSIQVGCLVYALRAKHD